MLNPKTRASHEVKKMVISVIFSVDDYSMELNDLPESQLNKIKDTVRSFFD
jgi:hypothetical protein